MLYANTMYKKHTAPGRYTSYAFFFIGLFLVIIVGSFMWKLVGLFRESKFDGTHQFILAAKTAAANTFDLAVFTPSDKSVAIFTVSGNIDAHELFPVPFDAVNTIGLPDANTSSDSLLHAMLFPKSPTVGLGIIDAYKLLLFSNGADKTITSMHVQNENTDVEKNYAKAFLDKDLYQEAKSLAIINATGKVGFGNDVSQMLSTIGANVISVGGVGDIKPQTAIEYAGERSYTLSRLERIFHVAAVKSTNPSPLADITIIIGEDYLKISKF